MPVEHELRSAAPSHATGAVEFVVLDELALDETFRLRPDGDVSLLATSLGRLGQLAPVELRPWSGAGSDGPRWQVVSGFRRLAATRLLARDRVLARLHRELSDADAWGLALGEALLREPLSRDELGALRERLRASGAAPWAEELVDEARVRAPVDAEMRERFFEWLSSATAVSAANATPVPATIATPVSAANATPVPATIATPVSAANAALTGLPRTPSPSSLGEGRGEGDGAATSPSPVPAPAPAEPSAAAGGTDPVEVTVEDLAADLVSRLAGLNQDLAIALEAWKDLPLEGRQQLLEQARWLAEAVPFMESEG